MVKPQLSIRTMLEITAVIALILAFYFARSPGDVGRYSVVANPNGGLMLLDTKTGECWWRGNGDTWHKSIQPIKD